MIAKALACCRFRLGSKRGVKMKEVHFFDSWPLPAFADWQDLYMQSNDSQPAAQRVWVDATASLLHEPWAPARIQALVPHARFVMLLRVRT